jgi:hypothetical protein
VRLRAQRKRVRPKEEEEGAAAAKLALKAHVLASDPEILAEMTDGERMMQEIAATVDLIEAPEDAVCGLVIDLLQYCEQEKIDWTQEVMSRGEPGGDRAASSSNASYFEWNVEGGGKRFRSFVGSALTACS